MQIKKHITKFGILETLQSPNFRFFQTLGHQNYCFSNKNEKKKLLIKRQNIKFIY